MGLGKIPSFPAGEGVGIANSMFRRYPRENMKYVNKDNVSCLSTCTLLCMVLRPQAHSKFLVIVQINTFTYLGTEIYLGEVGIEKEINKFLRILGPRNRITPPSNVQPDTRMRVHRTFAVTALMFGSECWQFKKADNRRITTAKMRFLLRTAGYTRMDEKNEDTQNKLKVI